MIFLANPIDLKQNRIYPIPNYGSAMSPFYTTLALWVGAFILLSLLSVEVKSFEDGVELSAREQFFGRYFTFVTIAIMQALVTTIGNLVLLKTYVVSPAVYVMLGVYTSIVFTMIIYTLVSVLRNIGKALAMVAMVLQVSASGGTFPIELMPHFFQNINPMLPFTYAIGAMREAVGGILPQALIKNIAVLLIFFLISIFFGVFFKEKANRLSEKFVKQFKDSGLAGE
ncbi:YhgE/Pip C-terminal domain protein [Clostridium carboxidivorans P7]|uniref:YhgE/Pip C-terminal domain protein n=1 Tax=Clostridium carboxidivorans P7 TaxID=536227 RepID=C6Q065_9CLOT|nr:YhgE/Pip domain-containing protein [Clostridium carboxidivorans]EET85108.1 YhgE/Pip C-terminal domain protein [Clostridium carboxidivorans P7]EFG87305.1 YhgE/Pip [Clostridium carboxidivorans P7]